MPRYIDADILLHKLHKSSVRNVATVIDIVESQPLVDMQEAKHGRWIEKPTIAYCSNCKVHWTKSFIISLRQTYKYCPNCGAKMDGGV